MRLGRGGGGYHPAFQRDPALIAEDVANGFVSREQARADYGVALYDGTDEVDADETARLRAERKERG